MATRGSMPKAAAVSAETTAISPSCSGVGFGRTAQSAKPHRRSSMTIRNREDTVEAPGLVLMIWKDGLMVCAVVWAAPDTMPSARPLWIIIVAKYEMSFMVSRASSMEMPFDLRSSANSAAKSSRCSEVAGSSRRAFDRSRLSTRARSRMNSGSPRMVSSQMSEDSSSSAAMRMRSSSPSGRTMWRLCSLACCSSHHWKRCGVQMTGTGAFSAAVRPSTSEAATTGTSSLGSSSTSPVRTTASGTA